MKRYESHQHAIKRTSFKRRKMQYGKHGHQICQDGKDDIRMYRLIFASSSHPHDQEMLTPSPFRIKTATAVWCPEILPDNLTLSDWITASIGSTQLQKSSFTCSRTGRPDPAGDLLQSAVS